MMMERVLGPEEEEEEEEELSKILFADDLPLQKSPTQKKSRKNHIKSKTKAKSHDFAAATLRLSPQHTTIRHALFPHVHPHHRIEKPKPDELFYPDGRSTPSIKQQRQSHQNRREKLWNTSFPAEYHHSHTTKDFEQTLAFQEKLNHQQRETRQLMASTSASGLPHAGSGSSGSFGSSASSIEELNVLKQITIREGLLTKLQSTAQFLAANSSDSSAITQHGHELLHLLLQVREASVEIMFGIAKWHEKARTMTHFVYQNKSYCLKMVSDLNFLSHIKSLGSILGIDPSKMKQNPFMMPAPIHERDFHAVQALSATKPPMESDQKNPLERVAMAERYLVWCLFHLPDMTFKTTKTTHVPSPPPVKTPQETLSWQKRAEKQLQMLSMPLEASSGQIHVMDSSPMMKRKGFLPSLPRSPPKTLVELMDSVHHHHTPFDNPPPTSPLAKRTSKTLQCVYGDGTVYKATAQELEALAGPSDAPQPSHLHPMVSLVAASVLILLSPSDRIPKDLSWSSCRKMFGNGNKLIQKLECMVATEISAFKWKAIVPFMSNPSFDPVVLSKCSHGASVLCAWIRTTVTTAQKHDAAKKNAVNSSDSDRKQLLDELDQADQVPEPVDKTKATKRVSIGSAEVLFINENQPVTMVSNSRPSSATISCPQDESTPVLASGPSVLVRTSPWTFHRVTYFVSFFLENDGALLSIKLYEPMSSVESQIFVDEDDLKQDFGAIALEYWQQRNYRLLCDLILSQLDQMMEVGRKKHEEKQQRQQPLAPSASLTTVTLERPKHVQFTTEEEDHVAEIHHTEEGSERLKKRRPTGLPKTPPPPDEEGSEALITAPEEAEEEAPETPEEPTETFSSAPEPAPSHWSAAEPPESTAPDPEEPEEPEKPETPETPETPEEPVVVPPTPSSRPETSASYASEQFEDDFEPDE